MPLLRRVLAGMASLRLTVACLALSVVLVFCGTVAQAEMGLYRALEMFFSGFFVWIELPGLGWVVPAMPGGALLGSVLLVNLVAAQASRFRRRWDQVGMWMLHSGVAILILAMLTGGSLSREAEMRLTPGVPQAFATSFREKELAVYDLSQPDRLPQIIREQQLRGQEWIALEGVPKSISTERFFVNSAPSMNVASEGLVGRDGRTLVEVSPAADPGESNTATAALLIRGTSEADAFRIVLSEGFVGGEEVRLSGRPLRLELRAKRFALPYSVELVEFHRELYPGSDVAKDYRSLVVVSDPATGATRRSLIRMNKPLRHGGNTHYQLAFGRDGKTSTLQVVGNPLWWMPYLSCLLVVAGMFTHFGIRVSRFASAGRGA